MKKRILSLLLILCLLFALGGAALAADSAEEAARALYDLGLFRGVGDNADGTPNFDLNSTPNRAQALVMLVRLLGKEAEALAGKWETPFTDVPEWAAPYVGYAYKNGLTNGTGETTFSSADPVNATQYITFVLRALGYESGKDFKWNAAWELSDEIGLTDGEYSEKHNDINRGDVAIISNDALDAQYKGEDKTLLETLVESGAVQKPSNVTEGNQGLIITVSSQKELTEALSREAKVEKIILGRSFTITEPSYVEFGGKKIDYYRFTEVVINKGVTVTVASGGELGVAWYTFEGDWEVNAPDAKLINDGTVVIEKGGKTDGEFTVNNGTIIVKDGAQAVCCIGNNGTVTVESGGWYRTSQGVAAVNAGTITIAKGAEMRSRFGSEIVNDINGKIILDGDFYCGCVRYTAVIPPEKEGEEPQEVIREDMWFTNMGSVSGSGKAFVYDSAAEDVAEGNPPFLAADLNAMKGQLEGWLAGSGITVGIYEGILPQR